ncbi:MAG: iron-sulfur cluster assembly accessory protein, partial [Rhodospirillaceae bacterium]
MSKITKDTAPITLTENAVKRVQALMARADKPVLGLRVGVTNTGCSGHMYNVEYAEDERPLEEVVEQDGVRIFIDPLALMFVVGSKMDYVEDKMQSGFIFD